MEFPHGTASDAILDDRLKGGKLHRSLSNNLLHERQRVHRRPLHHIDDKQPFHVLNEVFVGHVILNMVHCLCGDRSAHRVAHNNHRLIWICCSGVLQDGDGLLNKDVLRQLALLFAVMAAVTTEVESDYRAVVGFLFDDACEGSERESGMTGAMEAQEHVSSRACMVNRNLA